MKRKNQQQYTPTKILGVIPYSASTTVKLPNLDRTMMYRSINLRLTGSIVSSDAGGATQAKILGGDEWGIVTNISLVANGGQVLRSISGEALCILNYLLTGVPKKKNTLHGAQNVQLPFDSTLPLWMILPEGMSKYPIDTTLNAKALSDLYLQIAWGTPILNINTSASTVVGNTAIQVEVLAEQAYYLDPTVVPPFSVSTLQTQLIGSNLSASGIQQAGNVWQIPVGQEYALFMLNSKQTGTQTDTTGNAFGTGLIMSGTNQLQNVDLVAEYQLNRFRRLVAGQDFSLMFDNQVNNPGSWVVWMMARDGLLSEMLNLVDYQNCNMYVQSVGAAADISVTPLTVYPFKQITG